MKLRKHYESVSIPKTHFKNSKYYFLTNKIKSNYLRYKAKRDYNKQLVRFDDDSKIEKSKFLFVSTSALMNENRESIELTDIIKHFHALGHKINFIQPSYSLNLPDNQPYYNAFLPMDINGKQDLSKRDVENLKGFMDHLNTYLEIDCAKYFEGFKLELEKVAYRVELLNYYIRKSECQYIFCRSLYTEPWVIMAANNTAIKCIEVQHGVIGKDLVY
jgi:hypothetical protein